MVDPAVLYSDPNCPFCFVTEERLHELGLQDRVEWRGVQHAPELPVPTRTSTVVTAAELRHEVGSIRILASEVPIAAAPPAKPNTGRAIEHAAAALRADSAAGRRFVRALYRAFWVDGGDLADPKLLAQLAADCGLEPLTLSERTAADAALWRTSWQKANMPGVPLILRADGATLYGLADHNDLAAFFAE